MAASALDHLRSIENLRSIWRDYWRSNSKSAPGIDWVTPKTFNNDLKTQLRLLRDDVGEGYVYSPLRAIPIPKKDSDKKRLICIPTIRDRIIQRAVLQKIEARAAQLGVVNDASYGFVKDSLGTKRGAQAARKAAIGQRQKKPWALKADISAFFDNIERSPLITNFGAAFRLKSLEGLIRGAINCEVDERDATIRRILKTNGVTKGLGLRQGMPLSPMLSNFVLRDFDKAFLSRGYNLVRYADDLIVLAESKDECLRIYDFTVSELAKLKLEVSTAKTSIHSPDDPVEFLGMELGLQQGTDKYGLRVSDKQMREIRKSFTKYHDWTIAQTDQLDIGTLFLRLTRMQSGYGAAYGAADNIDDLDRNLRIWVQNCATKIYESMFGAPAVRGLSSKQKKFLMVP